LNIDGYKIEIEKTIERINKENLKRILLQIPEGLKPSINKISDYIKEKTEVDVFILADPCYGACDIPIFENSGLKIDMIIQIGHSEISDIYKGDIPIVFVNALSDINVKNDIIMIMEHLKGKKIGLVSTSQHVHILKDVKKILEEEKYQIIIPKGDKRVKYDGQILGCNFSVAKKIDDWVDCFLYIGSGNFHPLGLLLSTKKPVVIYDPYIKQVKTKELEELKEMILRQRYGAIARSKDAKTFGILIGTKTGQQRIKLALELKEKIESKDKKVYLIFLDFFSAENLMGFRDIDCFISTACPRIAIDDYMRYKRPILTAVELDILFGFKKWDDYVFDEIKN